VGVREVLTLLVMSALDLAKHARNMIIISWLMNKIFQKINHDVKKIISFNIKFLKQK
jgi:hypothetical protein